MSDRYVIISADCHGGGNIRDYREYLPASLHDEFDAWADSYVIPYDDMAGEDGDRNWNSAKRQRELEEDGIVAEVIFPNTVPPFFPKPSLGVQPPHMNEGDLAKRWEGLKAHNRWLADFCAETPGRRAGVAQVMLHDIPAAVEEVRWAKAHGLNGGIVLPGTPPGTGLPVLWDYDYYAPLWQVCEELEMPVNHHTGSSAPPMGDADIDHVIFVLEVVWWAHRLLYHLIFNGTLEKHPNMQLVFTEGGTAWVPGELMRLDHFYRRFRDAVGSQEYVWGNPVVSKLSLTPSEYWERQIHLGSSFIRPEEVPVRHQVGVDKVMWGSDYPHKEASYPFSREAIRLSFAGVPSDEIQMMLGGNAAKLYGFDLEGLRPVAEAIGAPTIEEMATPISSADIPIEAEKCPAFVGYVNK